MYLTIIKDGFKIKVYHNVLMVVDTLKNVKVSSATYCNLLKTKTNYKLICSKFHTIKHLHIHKISLTEEN